MRTPVDTMIAAVSEMEVASADGIALSAIAAKYGVTEATLNNWKAKFDAGEFDDEAEPTEEEEEEVAEYESGYAGEGGVFVLHTGGELPAHPEQQTDGARRDFPDEFKYRVARAVLRKEVSVGDVCKFYGMQRKNLVRWTDAVKQKKLTAPRKAAPAPPPPAAKKPPPVVASPPRAATNGHATRQQTLPTFNQQETIEMVDEDAVRLSAAENSAITALLQQQRQPSEAALVRATPMLAELQRLEADKSRLEAENARLKRRLAEALDMARRALLEEDHV